MSEKVKVIERTETTTNVDADGNETIQTLQTTSKIQQIKEPDYIKIYTNMWCEFNQIPQIYRGLFLALATRMSYANARDLNDSQLVNTGKPWNLGIIQDCGWSTEKGSNGRYKGQISLDKGLQALCECNAIRRVGRGVYQINPSYAGRGEWKYNPKLDRGGVDDLSVCFNFKDKTVNTQILWADDGSDIEYNKEMRKDLKVSKEDSAKISYTEIKDAENATKSAKTKKTKKRTDTV